MRKIAIARAPQALVVHAIAWIAQRGDGPDGLWPALVALTETHGFTLTVPPARPRTGGAHGWTNYATRTA